jgi:hypothetical protein
MGRANVEIGGRPVDNIEACGSDPRKLAAIVAGTVPSGPDAAIFKAIALAILKIIMTIVESIQGNGAKVGEGSETLSEGLPEPVVGGVVVGAPPAVQAAEVTTLVDGVPVIGVGAKGPVAIRMPGGGSGY